jgi:hypothetical protein
MRKRGWNTFEVTGRDEYAGTSVARYRRLAQVEAIAVGEDQI